MRDPKLKELQPMFTIFPVIQEYASRDLFVRHPSKDRKGLWSWHARADDIIVFRNDEKTNPSSMEQRVVARNTDILAALVVGAQRFQAALLVEPGTNGKVLSVAERAAFTERIWPTIEEANRDAPFHTRVLKSHVLFTNTRKPMLRAGKGTVQRSGTLKSYSAEIDKFHGDADTTSADADVQGIVAPGDLDDRLVSKKVRQFILDTAEWKTLGNSDNVFTLGMDSLQALVFVRKLKQGLAMPDIVLSTVYTNPSVNSLTNAIIQLLGQNRASKASNEQERLQERKTLFEEYREKIDSI